MSKTQAKTKNLYLMPVLSLVPLVAVLLLLSRTDIYLDSLVYAAASVAYVAINVIYRSLHGTLKIGYIVEYSLIALVAYFVLNQYA